MEENIEFCLRVSMCEWEYGIPFTNVNGSTRMLSDSETANSRNVEIKYLTTTLTDKSRLCKTLSGFFHFSITVHEYFCFCDFQHYGVLELLSSSG